MSAEEPQHVSELVNLVRVLIVSIRQGGIDASEGADLCRAASDLTLSVRHLLPKWWMRAACQAAANALLEAAIHLDAMMAAATGEPT